MRLVSLTVFLIVSLTSFSQQKIKRKVKRSIPLLTAHLTNGLYSEKEKVDVIYKWITENIAYDYDKLDQSKHLTGVDPKVILKQKKAICNGYVELTRAMLYEAGIKSETVTGYIHDEHWSPGKMVVSESHAWISIKIDGKWQLADPTWDAGYIGRIPIKRKPYKPKKYRKTEWKKHSKTINKNKKRQERERIRKENYDNKPTYSDKIGFVKNPGIEFYLIPSDTFLLSHLPIFPAWQLRDKILTIEEFSLSEDSIKLILKDRIKTFEESKKSIEEYTNENFLSQLIINGEEGCKFNKYNPGLKTLYYYNYLALVQDKNLQRLARGSRYEITKKKYPELAAKNDTVIKYVAGFKGFEKDNYKSNKSYDKEKFKYSQSFDKQNAKLVSKVKNQNEKIFGKIESNTKLIENAVEKLKSVKEQIVINYPKSVDKIGSEKLKELYIKNWEDSISKYSNIINNSFKLLDSLRNRTNFKTILNLCGNIEYLYEVNADYIRFNSYSTTEITNEIDSLILYRTNRVLSLYNDSVLLELLNKQIISDYKKVVSLGKLAKSEFKNLEAEHNLNLAYKYEEYIQSKIYAISNIMETNYLKSLSFNEQILIALTANKKDIKSILKLGEEQKELKEFKYDYISEKTEKSHLRSTDLVEKIKEDSKKWKKKFNN